MRKPKWILTAVLCIAVISLFPDLCHSEEIKIQVIVQKANVRANPDLKSEVITQVSLGTVLTSDKKEGNWYRVILPPDENGILRHAFIHTTVVEALTAPQEPHQKKQVKKEPAEEKAAVIPKQEVSEKVDFKIQTLTPQPKEKRSMEMGMRMKGGFGPYIGRNTLNDAYQGLNDYHKDHTDFMNVVLGNMTMEGELELLKSGPHWGGEIFYNINKYLGFGIGAGSLSGNSDGTFKFGDTWSGDLWQYTYSQKVSAPYVSISVYGGLPLGNSLRFVPYAGGGLYFGKIILGYNFVDKLPSGETFHTYDQSWIGKSTAFGFFGGVNFEYLLTRKIGIFIGAEGIMGTFRKITGDLEWDRWDSDLGSDSGTDNDLQLWSGTVDFSWMSLGQYTDYYLDNAEPSGTWISDVEPGVISLSQFRLVVGLTVFFIR